MGRFQRNLLFFPRPDIDIRTLSNVEGSHGLSHRGGGGPPGHRQRQADRRHRDEEERSSQENVAGSQHLGTEDARTSNGLLWLPTLINGEAVRKHFSIKEQDKKADFC